MFKKITFSLLPLFAPTLAMATGDADSVNIQGFNPAACVECVSEQPAVPVVADAGLLDRLEVILREVFEDDGATIVPGDDHP